MMRCQFLHIVTEMLKECTELSTPLVALTFTLYSDVFQNGITDT